VRLGAAGRVAGPFLGQVQLPVHQRPALGAGVGQKDADLAVLDPTGRARVLALHPGGLAALLVADHGHRRGHQPGLRPGQPGQLADDLRGQWAIENGLHSVRDVTLGEDASQVRTGTGRTSWRAWATWSSAPSAAPGRSTSPPPSGSTAATPHRPLATLGISLG
jgi:hypothetical protein